MNLPCASSPSRKSRATAPSPHKLQHITKSTRKGFSLTELLVCLALVSLLGTIVFAAVNQVREKGMITRDASNLRQLTQAALLYSNDKEGFLPPTYGTINSDGTRIINTAWWSELFPAYIQSAEVFTSPVDYSGFKPPYEATWKKNGVTYPEVKISYGATGHNETQRDAKALGKPLSKLSSPGSTALFTHFHHEDKRLSKQWFGQHPRWLSEVTFPFSGGSEVNISFIDGHVELMEREQIREAIKSKRLIWDVDAP